MYPRQFNVLERMTRSCSDLTFSISSFNQMLELKCIISEQTKALLEPRNIFGLDVILGILHRVIFKFWLAPTP